jgi:hypothetical protein
MREGNWINRKSNYKVELHYSNQEEEIEHVKLNYSFRVKYFLIELND